MSLKQWKISNVNKDRAVELAKECDIDKFCALLLSIRGIDDPIEIEEFLSDEINLQSPFGFTDMDKAVKTLNEALENSDKIAIFGDYDCDGITATALLYTYLTNEGANVIYRLPSRDEGYGISEVAINEFIKKKVKLIITVDNGISAVNEIAYAAKNGIKTIVTDHHNPPEILPNAEAIVDPKRKDCISTFKDLAGVGVAFMLACAHAGCECEELLPEYGDLVTLGTVADVMPVKGDNRQIIKYGLELMKRHSRDSITALISAAGMDKKEITAQLISFCLAPRLNAAGRMLDPIKGIDLLLCDDIHKSAPLARELNELNQERQMLESDISELACNALYENDDNMRAPVLVVSGEGWHHGVLGLIASRLCKRFSRPCIAFSIDDGIATGSARSYSDVSIFKLISNCKSLLSTFGGHDCAAGLSLPADKLELFKSQINSYAHEVYPILPFDTVNICCKLNPKTMSIANVYSQNQLQPFGNGNEQPIYGLYQLKINTVTPVGKGNHLKISVQRDNIHFTVMKFFTTVEEFTYIPGDMVDLAVTLDINRFADRENLSIVVCDIKPSEIDNEKTVQDIRQYENFRIFGVIPECSPPTRDEIAAVYKIIRKSGHLFAPVDCMMKRLECNDCLKMHIILDILSECELIELICRENIQIKIIPTDKKVDLTTSETYKKLEKAVK